MIGPIFILNRTQLRMPRTLSKSAREANFNTLMEEVKPESEAILDVSLRGSAGETPGGSTQVARAVALATSVINDRAPCCVEQVAVPGDGELRMSKRQSTASVVETKDGSAMRRDVRRSA